MQIPEGGSLPSWEQEGPILQAVHNLHQTGLHELDDPTGLAFDIIDELHKMGFYIAESGKEIRFPTKNNTGETE